MVNKVVSAGGGNGLQALNGETVSYEQLLKVCRKMRLPYPDMEQVTRDDLLRFADQGDIRNASPILEDVTDAVSSFQTIHLLFGIML